ncbi:MAG: DUF1499 domain-containing protein [Epsilonproteobacteria bacterium]|nr:MAG: DUF1499 domain-containing protein [Campylobacterota bacterium]RLA67015.1 MAG: DUF1499 domain-containing protein [Campylobacterota bacterium]
MKKILISLLLVVSCSSKDIKNIGLIEKGGATKFKLCPKKPNCYSSAEAIDSDNYFFPITIKEPKLVAFEKSLKIIAKMGGKVITQKKYYIHATFTSSIFRFIDDLEVYTGDQDIVQIKSSSRMGHSDLGVNKKRLSDFTFRYHQSR